MALALRYVINWSCICCCCSVTQLCMTLCNPMLCSILGFPVLHHLLEFSQTHLHWVGDAIQPSHPLSFPSPPAFNLSQLRAFSNESVLHIRWPKCWSFSFSISPSNECSGLISIRMDWLDLLAPGSGRSPGEGNDNPLQYSCLENYMHRGAWRAHVHGVSKSQTPLSD